MHPPTAIMQNPGSVGYAAGGAFAGRVIGGLPGLLVASMEAKAAEGEESSTPVAGMAVRWVGQIAGAAGGASLGAPEGLKGRAAIGAAIGGAVPILGAPLAALGAYLATRPKGRQANPLSPTASVALVGLGLLTAGGLVYAGVKALEARSAAEEGGAAEDEEGNVDDWGWDLDRYELWGLQPVEGQDGKDYFYRIYKSLETGEFEIAYVGDTQSGSMGPYDTSADAEWCAENRLPLPCVPPGA